MPGDPQVVRADGMCLGGSAPESRHEGFALPSRRYLLYQQQGLLHGPVPLGSAISAEVHTVCYIAGF